MRLSIFEAGSQLVGAYRRLNDSHLTDTQCSKTLTINAREVVDIYTRYASMARYILTRRDEFQPCVVMEAAALLGDLDLVQHVYTSNDMIFSSLALTRACQGGHLDIVEYLYYRLSIHNIYTQMIVAITHRHLHVVKFLHNTGVDYHPSVI